MLDKNVLLAKLDGALEHIAKVEEYVSKITHHEEFYTHQNCEMIFDATMMRLQALGESLKQIENKSPETFEKYSNVEWVKIIRFRDIISHHYEKLESEIIFDVCKNHLPLLKQSISKIISELG